MYALIFGHIPRQLRSDTAWNPTSLVAGIDLLGHQWFRRGNEYDLSLGKPVVIWRKALVSYYGH